MAVGCIKACTAEVFEVMMSEEEKTQSIPLEELIKAQMTDQQGTRHSTLYLVDNPD